MPSDLVYLNEAASREGGLRRFGPTSLRSDSRGYLQRSVFFFIRTVEGRREWVVVEVK